jgi:RecJ-like exonuclease
MTKIECPRCNGKGTIKAYGHVLGGVCFMCGGSGKVEGSDKPKKASKWASINASHCNTVEEAKNYRIATFVERFPELEGELLKYPELVENLGNGGWTTKTQGLKNLVAILKGEIE